MRAVQEATGYVDKIFDEEMFAYFDDSILGVRLWNKGYKIVSCPIKMGYHRRSSTFLRVSARKLYLQTRGYFALNELCNSRFKELIKTTIIHKMTYSLLISSYQKLLGARSRASARELLYAIYKGYRDGIKWAKHKLRKEKTRLDIYKVPLLYISGPTLLASLLTGLGLYYLRKAYTEIVTKEFEKQIERYRIQ